MGSQPNQQQTYPQSFNNTGAYIWKSGDVRLFGNVDRPVAPSSADKFFSQGVDYFTSGNYTRAADSFAQAKADSPSDIILPFAQIQALFADGKFDKAANILRDTLNKQPAGSVWAFYPEGLYTDSQTLVRQLEPLLSQASADSDYQLLAGYQLLGIGNYDDAQSYISRAKEDSSTRIAAEKLQNILDNLKSNSFTTSSPTTPTSNTESEY